MSAPREIHVVDSHTEGEPTRVVVAGGPDLGAGTAAERSALLARSFDTFRSSVCNEPRGFDAIVGALLCAPVSEHAAAQIVFFNNVGTLRMCVHGTIGVAETLRHLGRLGAGRHRFETPAGDVLVEFLPDGSVAVENVASYRHLAAVEVELPGGRSVTGDVAYGGNWFFLTDDHGEALERSRVAELTEFAQGIRRSLVQQGIRGAGGAEVDHVELFAPPMRPDAHSRNFVLCPGGEYDRSPCGTGTSAKLACLAAGGALREGEVWRQESILGTLFHGTYRRAAQTPERGAPGIVPTIAGRAFVTGEGKLLLHDDDPFRFGIRPTAAPAPRTPAPEGSTA